MLKFFIFFFSVSMPCLAGMKSLTESMHGEKMKVEYQALNSGRHVLLVQEKTGAGADKAVFRQSQVIDLKLKKDEALSLHYGFKCSNAKNEFVYGVISKSHAKEHGEFKPERAWAVNEKSLRLDVIPDLKGVNCKWSPEGDGAYPFR